MNEISWHAFYQSDLQSLYALLVVPVAFLAYRLIVRGSMVQGVAFRGEDESPVLERAHPNRWHRYMSPAMKLIGRHDRETETDDAGGERLHQQRGRGRKQKHANGEGNRGEAVVARDLEEVVSCHGECIGVMFAEGCDQGWTQDRRPRIEKAIR